jgi:hypothetical protein
MFHTGILIAGMTSIFLFCGFLVGDEDGIIALLIALVMGGFPIGMPKNHLVGVRCQGSLPQFHAYILRDP